MPKIYFAFAYLWQRRRKLNVGVLYVGFNIMDNLCNIVSEFDKQINDFNG